MNGDEGAPVEGEHGDRPVVDVTPALGTAGHETEDLGFTDVEDSAPVQHHVEDHDLDEDPEDEILRHIASRGVDGVT